MHDRTYFLAWNGKKDQGKDLVEEQYFMSDHQIRRIGIRHLGEVWKICDFVWSTGCSSLDRDRHVGAGNLAVRNACGRGRAFFYLMRRAIGRARIIKGVKAIADGQVDYQIPLNGLKGGQLEATVSINKIGDGLDRAVEESVKNERLKTDLITNVSHDIKTPLHQSLIMWTFLKREDFEDPKIRNYLQVLEEKSISSEDTYRGCGRSFQGKQWQYQPGNDESESG